MPAALDIAAKLHQDDLGFAPGSALTGDVYMAASQPEKAANAYHEAAVSAPSQLLTLREAAALQRAGKPQAAEGALRDWGTSHPDDTPVAEALSQLQIDAHDYDPAARTLQAVLARHPHDPSVMNNLAWVYQLKNNTKAARDLAEQAYVMAPTPETADTLGWVLTREGNAGKGVPLLREATAGGDDPRIAYHLAVALKDVGQRDECVRLLKLVAAADGQFDEKAEARQLLAEMSKPQ